jgi:hypothetical protein
MMITGGNINDTTMMTVVLEDIRVPRAGKGRPRTRPDRVLADKGYPSRKNRAWLRGRGIAATIPERDDQIAHRRKKPGRPIDFGDQQKERYKGRNVVEAVWSHLKRSLANLARQDTGQLTALVKTRLTRMQYRPGLIDGFLTAARLDLTPFVTLTIKDR